MIPRAAQGLWAGSLLCLVSAALAFVLAEPGKRLPLVEDFRAPICGTDCFPVAHPWLLIVAGAFAIVGLLGLRTSYKRR